MANQLVCQLTCNVQSSSQAIYQSGQLYVQRNSLTAAAAAAAAATRMRTLVQARKMFCLRANQYTAATITLLFSSIYYSLVYCSISSTSAVSRIFVCCTELWSVRTELFAVQLSASFRLSVCLVGLQFPIVSSADVLYIVCLLAKNDWVCVHKIYVLIWLYDYLQLC